MQKVGKSYPVVDILSSSELWLSDLTYIPVVEMVVCPSIYRTSSKFFPEFNSLIAHVCLKAWGVALI
jgi:hypothetical protein